MCTGCWKNNQRSGSCRKAIARFERLLATIIVCPYQHLVEQWVEDIVKFNIKPIMGILIHPQRLEKETRKG